MEKKHLQTKHGNTENLSIVKSLLLFLLTDMLLPDELRQMVVQELQF